MSSKLKKAIGAMKDHTSIGLARVGRHESSALEVAILKATTHNEQPVDERHVAEVLQMVSSDRWFTGCCARAIGRRVGRTRSWTVALKSLVLVLRILQTGDPYFSKEVIQAMKRGYKILNLSTFRDESTAGNAWDFTAFVRAFAVYLDERLDCFLAGKLLGRMKNYAGEERESGGYSGRRNEHVLKHMKPCILFDWISHWQRLLDRAIATRPTGAARMNRLVQSSLYAIVQETLELYRDISDGLARLLDGFFDLKRNDCINVYNAYIKASKQFKELCSFYGLCKGIGVGRNFEYPTIRKVPQELMDTLHEFVFKDQHSETDCRTPGMHLPMGAPLSVKGSESERGGSQCLSLEDLMSVDPRFSPERYSDPGGEKPAPIEEFYVDNDTGSAKSDPNGIISVADLLSLEDPASKHDGQVQRQGQEKITESKYKESSLSIGQCWEIALFERTLSQKGDLDHNHHEVANNKNGFELDLSKSTNSDNNVSINQSPWLPSKQNYNPFSQDSVQLGFNVAEIAPPNFNVEPTFKANLSSEDTNSTNNFSSGFPIEPTFRVEFGNGDNNNKNDSHCDYYLRGVGENPDVANLPLQASSLGPGGCRIGVVPPTFSAGFRGEKESGDAMGAIVPFGRQGNDDPFSSGPTFQAIPTFRATGAEMARSDLGNMHDDPFGSFPSEEQRMSNGSSLAMVPFGQVSFDDQLSAGSTFQATPAFRATVVEMARSDLGNMHDNPFGSFSSGEQRMSGGSSLAMVPFGQVNIDNQSSPNPTFRATPTFQATGLEMDRRDTDNRQDNPFRSTIPIGEQWTSNTSPAMVPFGQVRTDDQFPPSSTFQAVPTFQATNMYQHGIINEQDDSFESLPIREQRLSSGSSTMVPFGQAGTDSMSSLGYGFQATPTFGVMGFEMGLSGASNKQYDPFASLPSGNGSFLEQQSASQEQQLWFHNENKIMARHFTSMHGSSVMKPNQALTFST